MPWEALAWCAVAVLAPAVAAAGWPGWKRRLGSAAQPLEQIGPWLHGVGPAYLALIRGAILSRDAGLRGHDLMAWLGGGLAATAILAVVAWAVRRQATQPAWPDPLRALVDEPRWALYRAAGALWLSSHPLGTGLGIGLGLLEWALFHKPWQGQWAAHPSSTGALLRLASSSLIFLLTRNFWLTCLAGASLLAIVGRGRPSASVQGP